MKTFKREIASRNADGIEVTLFAHFERDEISNRTETIDISCHVTDSRNGTDFTISDIPKNRALEVYEHPFSVGNSLLMKGSM